MIIICVTGILAYSNSFRSPFVFDDLPNITENTHIRITGLDLKQLKDAGFKSKNPNRPVANISFAFNYYWGRYHVAWYHVVNLLIHLVNGCLAYLLACLIFRQWSCIQVQPFPQTHASLLDQTSQLHILFPALFTGLFFTLHPVQVQSVTYIVQRMNSMAAMFCFISAILFVAGRRTKRKWNQWAAWGGSLASWLLALGTKEIAATLPLVLLLYDWYFFQDLSREGVKRMLKYLAGAGVILVSVMYLYLGNHPIDTILSGYHGRDFTLGERLLTQGRVLMSYMGLVIYPLPSRLNLLHHIPYSRSLLSPVSTLYAMAVVVVLLILAALLARKHRIVSFGILWFFIHLAIESSVIPLEMMFEHRLYLPVFGVAVIVSVLLTPLVFRTRTRAIMVSTLIILGLGAGTYLRNFTWQDRITLWSDVVSKSPESPRAHNNLGLALAADGQPEAAIRHYTRALVLNPIDSEIFNNLGMALAQQGNVEAAVDRYSTALRLDPNNAGAHYNLGISLERQGKTDAALNHLLQAIRIEPDFSEAHNNLGLILRRRGKLQEAVDHFSQAIKVQPDNVRAYNNMGVSLEQSGQSASAVTYYLEALRLKPDYLEAYVNLGAAFTSLGNLDEAVRSLNRALRLNPLDAGIHNNLGVVLHRKGNFKNAVKHFSRALEIKPGYGDAHTNMGITLFEQGHVVEAIPHFQEALRLDPNNPVLRRNLEKALQRLKGS